MWNLTYPLVRRVEYASVKLMLVPAGYHVALASVALMPSGKLEGRTNDAHRDASDVFDCCRGNILAPDIVADAAKIASGKVRNAMAGNVCRNVRWGRKSCRSRPMLPVDNCPGQTRTKFTRCLRFEYSVEIDFLPSVQHQAENAEMDACHQ